MSEKEYNKVVFFGSGSFPVETFKALLRSNICTVAGLVTSNDRLEFGDERLVDIAKENGIPYYIPNDLKDGEFLEWLRQREARLFCVISYKFLPKEVIELCNGISFNVHASLLPYLRGAAPITWAIRLGFKETGITLFKLSDSIDCGDIIESHKVGIGDDETYGELYVKLAGLCAEKTSIYVDRYFNEPLYGLPSVAQGGIPKEYAGLPVFHAPKLNGRNTTFVPFGRTSAVQLYDMIRSLSPNIGLSFNLIIRDDRQRVYDSRFYLSETQIVKEVKFKVYEAKLLLAKSAVREAVITDWKNYLYIKPDVYSNDVVSVLKIQMPGKRVLDVKEFLKGFQNLRKPNYSYGFL